MSVLASSTSVTGTREEVVETAKAVRTAKAIETVKVTKDSKKSEGEYPNLARVLCIRYPITFRKKSVPMSALFDSRSEVNTIYLTLARELELLIRPTDI